MAGYAIVKASGPEFVLEKGEKLSQPASAQLAELIGLTEACLMAEGKQVKIYTCDAWNLFGAVLKNRGLRRQMALQYSTMNKY